MDVNTYYIEHKVEQDHWWFFGRRELFKEHIKELRLPKSASILDIGSSSGTNLRMLQEMGFENYQGLDISIEAQRFCHDKGLGEVVISDIQTDNVGTDRFDLILATDVLEHLEKDGKALENILCALKHQGTLLLTVPCFKILWGPQDIVAHHIRRYTKSKLEKKLTEMGFKIIKSNYFNFLLFFPILFMRKLLLLFRIHVNENKINNETINRLLKNIFLFDCMLAQKVKIPFGVSALFIAQKN
jgi:SAM-dependent methyltransferase